MARRSLWVAAVLVPLIVGVSVVATLKLGKAPVLAPEMASVEMAAVQQTVVLRGRIQPSYSVPVVPEIAGTIIGQVPETGQRVALRDPLLALQSEAGFVRLVEDALLAVEQGQTEIARQSRVAIRSQVTGEFLRWLVEPGSVVESESVVAEIRVAGSSDSEASIFEVAAPVSGVILSFLVQPKNAVGPSDALPLAFIAPSETPAHAEGARFLDQQDRLAGARSNLATLALRANRPFPDSSIPLDRAYIISPLAGVVSWRSLGLANGVPIRVGQEVLKISSSNLVIVSSVHEVDYPNLMVGGLTTVAFDAIPEREFAAHLVEKQQTPVQSIFEQFSEYSAVFTLREDDERLVDGMSCSLSVVVNDRGEVVSVPRSAVFRNEKQNSCVMVQSEYGELKTVVVQIGLVGDDRVEIVSGLELDDRVVRFPAKLRKS